MVDALYESYTQNKLEDYQGLPEMAKQLINQGIEDIDKGLVHAHEDVMAEFKKKYNLV